MLSSQQLTDSVIHSESLNWFGLTQAEKSDDLINGAKISYEHQICVGLLFIVNENHVQVDWKSFVT